MLAPHGSLVSCCVSCWGSSHCRVWGGPVPSCFAACAPSSFGLFLLLLACSLLLVCGARGVACRSLHPIVPVGLSGVGEGASRNKTNRHSALANRCHYIRQTLCTASAMVLQEAALGPIIHWGHSGSNSHKPSPWHTEIVFHRGDSYRVRLRAVRSFANSELSHKQNIQNIALLMRKSESNNGHGNDVSNAHVASRPLHGMAAFVNEKTSFLVRPNAAALHLTIYCIDARGCEGKGGCGKGTAARTTASCAHPNKTVREADVHGALPYFAKQRYGCRFGSLWRRLLSKHRGWPGMHQKGTNLRGGVGQAVGGGCQSGWERLLSVTNAINAGTWRQGDSGWA